ncbi:WPP domain-associated protein [Nymphaea colorata]|nr:WPP domain-associated protein [Nymphaea colorata]XP_031500203.1 WPP domain-associated protein [Nymphaea colorata]
MRFGGMEEFHNSLDNRTRVQLNGSFEGNNNFDDGSEHYKQLVSQTETFFDELCDRITVSAIVNESVTEGIVKALSEEANESISVKDTEIDNLRDKLRSYESEILRLKYSLENGHVENGSLGATSSSSRRQPKESSLLMADASHSKTDEYLQDGRGGVEKEFKGVVRVQAEEQWKKIMRGMADIRTLVSCKSVDHLNFNNGTVVNKSSSFSDSNGTFEAESASCDLHEASASSKLRMVFDKISKMEEELGSLRDISDKVFQDMYDDFMLSKSTSIECQWMWQFQEAVNAVVMQDFIQSIQQHSEEELQKTKVISMQHDAWLSQMEAISSLHEELENMSQTLFGFESGSLLLRGSHEDEEANGPKRIQRKVLENRIPSGHQERNASIVSSEESTSGISVSSDAAEFAHLKHMTREELISHFKAEMLKMSRNHESELHTATEKYFQLKRELLKDKGSLHTRKDKDLEGVKKRILKVIDNLDNIMKQNIKFSFIFDDYRRTCGLISKLTKENENLKSELSDRKKEIRLLSSQVIDARQKLTRQSSTELSLLKQIRRYKFELEECEMKGFIMNDVYITVLKELILGHECEITDSDLAAIILHELGELILQETVRDAGTFMKFAMESYCEAKKLGYKFESLAEERGEAISIEMQEKEQLKGEKKLLLSLLEEKEKLELEAVSTLTRRQEELSIVSQECDTLRHRIRQQESLIMGKDHKLATISRSLELASQQLDKYSNDLKVLEQRLKLTSDDLHEARDQRIRLEHAVQEKQQTAFVFLEKEREQKKQLEVLSEFVTKCSKEMKEFERNVVHTISLHNLRFGKLDDTLRPLIQQGSLLRNRGVWCKKIFSDLQKAEAEVDLLGDEVDTLLNLLEKIYFALDHYSPVLKYYPGIMEILKLVKQELSGEKSTLSPLASHELDWKR